jgi:FlaA1/EpsC-like NDP-sugar epimerase
VSIEDLLGRDIVPPNQDLLHRNITGKMVMVTGAGGSIGSELCRQIVRLKPLALLLFEQSEFALYSIDRELKSIAAEDNVELIPLLGSVLDSARLKEVIRAYGVHTLYHAAAYKHVPMVERNPAEAVVNNALGTWHVAMVANECMIETFVLISTDKAVRPTNTMGATKRLAELICQGMAIREGKVNTRFSIVRFGNVLGSSGSVVPLFREQIRNGGPLTVTDPKMIRYFMTIPEASQLVIQAGAMAQGGDIFVLDMGVPVKIIDLAKRMVHLSGFEVKDDERPNGDIEIVFTGLRPGEKLYEELLIGDDVQPTSHPLIMRSQEEALPWPKLDSYLSQLEKAALAHDQVRIRELLLESVSGYKPQCGIEDNVLRRMSSSANGKVYSLTPK